MTQNTIFTGRKAVYFTLGCKLNFAETSSIARRLSELGVRRAAKGEVADICIVNTCSVTEVADHKCRQAIHKLVRQHPGAIVAVMGCYAQLQPETIAAIEGVSLVLSQSEKGEIVERIREKLEEKENGAYGANGANEAHETHETHETHEAHEPQQPHKPHEPHKAHKPHEPQQQFFPSCSRGERTRYFLKVQDGCNYFCTYCTIPFARGRSRNGSIADLVAQARQAAAEGGREIVLTGVNIGDFGHSTNEQFIDLLRELDKVEGIERYRISSIEPNLLTDEVLEFCASSRAFMPHFHIPLQSGSDEVLRLMHRRYDTAFFYNKIARVRELMPDAFIGVDVIVGTRGETAALFDEAERFVESLPVSQLHVFSYSERPGTAALRIPHSVRPEEKHERSQRLIAISNQKLHDFYEHYIGTTRKVLVEHSRKAGISNGFTDNYIKVEIKDAASQLDNKIIDLHLKSWNNDGTALVTIAP